MGGLVCGNVRVDQDGFLVGLLQGLDGLGATVVELPGLAYGQPTGADDQDGVNAFYQLWVITWRVEDGRGRRGGCIYGGHASIWIW